MSISIVGICNQALEELGSPEVIADINEDTPSAKAMKRVYARTVDQMLHGADWKWAEQYTGILPALTDDSPESRYAYWYKVPGDSLRVREVLNEDRIRPFKPHPFVVWTDPTQGRVIGTDVFEARIRYTRKIEDASSFDPGFELALVYSLASKVAMRITQSAVLRAEMRKAASIQIEVALSGGEGEDPETTDSNAISERFVD